MESIIDKSKQDQKFVYEEERIFNLSHVEAFLPELICGICNNILKNPIECKNCEKPLCGDCKTNWFMQNPNTCPYCRNKSQFDRVNRMTRNLLCKLIFRCCHADKGCSDVFPYEKLFQHQDQCPTIIFRCQQCSFIGVLDSSDQKLHNCVQFLTSQLKIAQ